MSETRWKPSLTVSAVIEQDGRYLLIEEHTSRGLRLSTPAGHLEPGESPLDAAVRETLEESGHHFQPQALVGVYLAAASGAPATRRTWLRIAFCGRVGAPVPGCRLDDGIVRTIWMTPEEIRASRRRHRSPIVLRCIEDHLRGQRFALEAVYTDGSALAV